MTDEPGVAASANGFGAEAGERWVNLIHETLIRRAPGDAEEPRPYWPALWDYIEKNKHRAARSERLRLQAREWGEKRGFGRLFGLAPWASVGPFRRLAARGSVEARYLRWSWASLAAQALVAAALLAVIVESMIWLNKYDQPVEALAVRWQHWFGNSPPFPDLVKIPIGSFMMGSEDGDSDERPVREVRIDAPFYFGASEVTFEQYDAFAEATGRALPSAWDWGRKNRPVIDVNWDDAMAYARWLDAMTGSGCRLPSEAEWEYAARAGTKTAFGLPAPDGGDDLSGYANCVDCGRSEHVKPELNEQIGARSLPGGSFPANAWGVHDMHGNVWEWVEDCWHGSYQGAPDDGSAWLEENGGDCGRRVLRGGSWSSGQDVARSAFRLRLNPNSRFNYIGFRVLCSSSISNTDH